MKQLFLLLVAILFSTSVFSQSMSDLKTTLEQYKSELVLVKGITKDPNKWEKVNDLALKVCELRDQLLKAKPNQRDLVILDLIKFEVDHKPVTLKNGRKVKTVKGRGTDVSKIISMF